MPLAISPNNNVRKLKIERILNVLLYIDILADLEVKDVAKITL